MKKGIIIKDRKKGGTRRGGKGSWVGELTRKSSGWRWYLSLHSKKVLEIFIFAHCSFHRLSLFCWYAGALILFDFQNWMKDDFIDCQEDLSVYFPVLLRPFLCIIIWYALMSEKFFFFLFRSFFSFFIKKISYTFVCFCHVQGYYSL